MRSLALSDETPELTVLPSIGGREATSLRLQISGRLETSSIARLWEEALILVNERPQRGSGTQATSESPSKGAAGVELLASGISYCDGAGAAMIADLRHQVEADGDLFELHGFPAKYQPILDLIAAPVPPARVCEDPKGWLEFLGRRSVEICDDAIELLYYVGKLSVTFFWACLSPRTIRWKDCFRSAQSAGVNSFPVVALVCGLLGLILGFQAIIVLRPLGAENMLAIMVSKSMLRELGPLMTAVVLTARSGSAFAAEIGTMRVNEEVDALETMGVDAVHFLVTPRLLSALVMTPILTVFANVFGLLGGAVIWVGVVDLPFGTYVDACMESITVADLVGGIIKAFVFGVLVAGVGCVRGLQTRGGAIAVGESATRAVVSGIVLIALCDSLFTFIFYTLEI